LGGYFGEHEYQAKSVKFTLNTKENV
jgi:hypothetical protein